MIFYSFLSQINNKVFAEILKDPVFVFSSKLSAIPKDVFEGLFGKSLNKMEQRELQTVYKISNELTRLEIQRIS